MIEPLILRPDEAILSRHPALLKLAAELSDVYADRGKLVTDEALQAIGSLLWHALDADEPFQQARKRAGQHLLPIVIESSKPEILHLPWETIYHPESGFLGRSEGFTLSRAMPSTGAELPAIEDGPLRVLLFTALPDDIGEEEQLRIEEGRRWCLRRLASGGRAAMCCLKCRMTGDSASLLTSFSTSGRTWSISADTAYSEKMA